eukprot:NODE_1143_length_738_cov_0.303599.p1 type:complete len:107 gc:universal NODE_1143_length_738_cov_0.303599:277-597(+)
MESHFLSQKKFSFRNTSHPDCVQSLTSTPMLVRDYARKFYFLLCLARNASTRQKIILNLSLTHCALFGMSNRSRPLPLVVALDSNILIEKATEYLYANLAHVEYQQ